MKLTKREKVMLYILAVIALIAGMQLLIIQPAMNASDTLDETILEREQTEFAMQQMIATRDAEEKSLTESVEGVETEEKYFLPLMTNEELDRYITGNLQKCHLTAESLVISEDVAQTSSEAVKCFGVSVTARGNLWDFTELVEWAKATDGVRISAIGLEDESPQPTDTPAPTKTPKPTRTPKKSRRATPTPAPTETPGPTPTDASLYKMSITFIVAEYDPTVAESVMNADDTPTAAPAETPAAETAE